MKCQRKTANGKPCKAPAIKGGRYCFQHAPETAAAADAARRLGGLNRGTPHAGNVETIAEKPRTMEEVFTILDYVKAETVAMENGIQRNRLLVSIAAEYKDAIKTGDLEKQLQELLAILSSRPDPVKGK